MGQRNDNMTFRFQDILKYIGKPKRNEDMRQGLEQIWDQFVDWEDSNSSQPPFDWSKLSLGDHIEPGMSTYTRIRTGLLSSILICSSVLGVAVNVFVTVTAILNHKKLQASRVVLIVNLCLACLLFLVGGMPLLLLENVFGLGWNHGATACQLHRYIVYGSFYLMSYSVVLLLLHITLVMWIPLRLVKLDKPGYTIVLCCTLWLLVLLCNIPNYLGHGVMDEVPGVSYCYHKEIHADLYKVRAWTSLQFSFTFALPLFLMAVLTILTLLRMCGAPPGEYAELHDVTNSRRDVTLLSVCVTLTFLVCWLPDKVFSLYLVFQDVSTRMGMGLLVASDVMMCLAYSNPSINPVLILLCILRHFLPCVSRAPHHSANVCKGTNRETNQNADNYHQSQPITNPEDKLIISVV